MQAMKKSAKERGVAMFMAIFALLLLTAIAAGFVFMANTETAINSNYRSSQQAYFAAKAGLEEARARIGFGIGDITAPAKSGLPALPTATPNTSTPHVVYIINPRGTETIAPWDPSNQYWDDSLCKANYPGLALDYGSAGIPCAGTAPTGTAWYASTNSTLPGVGTDHSFPMKWARISLKTNRASSPKTASGGYPTSVNCIGTDCADSTANDVLICWDGDKQILLPSGYTNCHTPPAGTTNEYRPVYLLTAMAVVPSGLGRSRRVLTMEVADDPPFFSNSAINSQDYVTLNGSLRIDGYDYCSCQCVEETKGSTTTYTCTDRSGSTCIRDKYAIYSNSGVDKPANSALVTAGTSPVIAENQSFKYDLDRLIDRYRNMANTVDVTLKTYRNSLTGATKNSLGQVCAAGVTGCSEVYGYACGGSDTNCETQSNQFFGVPPVLPPDPPSAPVEQTGAPAEKQITYVPGDLKLTSSAKGNGVLVVEGNLEINGGMEFYGLIIVKGVVKFTGGGSDKTNIYGSVLAGQSALDQVVVGGSASIKYNRCALENTTGAQPPRMLNTREMNF